MTDFKLKIVLGEATVELEGEAQLVKEIFADIKETGLGYFTKTIPYKEKEQKMINSDHVYKNNIISAESSEFEEFQFPNLKDLTISGNLRSDQDKILVFAYYLSNFGQKEVNETEIKNQFKELNLWTKSIGAHFKANMKKLIADKKMSSYGDVGYTVTQCGQEQAKLIINNENPALQQRKAKNTKSQKNSAQKYGFIDLNLSTEEKKSLVDLFANKENLSNIDKTLLAAHWYKQCKKIDSLSKDVVFTLFKNANVSTSFSIKDALNNAKKKNYFFSGQTKGEYEISHIAEEHIENNLLRQDDSWKI